MTAAEPVVDLMAALRASIEAATAGRTSGPSAAAERVARGAALLDELPDFQPWEKQRPVLVELSTTYVVWVDADSDIEKLRRRGDWYEDCHGENAVGCGQSVTEPEYGSDWDEVYDQAGDVEPPDQIEGPMWRCPEVRCGAIHTAGAPWERRHNPFCPSLARPTP